MFNELLYDKDLRDKLANTDELFAIIKDLSSLPEKSKEAGLFTILGVAQFYRTKTQNITDILNEHLDEFMSDGYKQYTQLELINAYTNPFIALKKLKRIEQIRSFVEIEYVDNYTIQILENGRYMLTKEAVLRLACFMEGSSIANYIREIFLENKAIVNSQNNQLGKELEEDLLYENLQTKLIEERVKAELKGDTYTVAKLNHELFVLKNQRIREKLVKEKNKSIVDFCIREEK